MTMLEKARDYLLKEQKADGSWGSGDPVECGRALYACLVSSVSEDILSSGVEYLIACQAGDGHFQGRTKVYSDATNTAYALYVLNQFHYSKATLPGSKGLMWLVENQSPDGSWSGSNTTKKAYTTSMCMRALHAYNLYIMKRYKLAMDFLLAYMRSYDFEKEPVSHVYAPVLNLKRMSALDDDIAEKFMAYAEKELPRAMEEGNIPDVAYLSGTVAALKDHEADVGAVRWLESVQESDGGFKSKAGPVNGPGLTALVMLAISNKL